jgi:hypothetical protein
LLSMQGGREGKQRRAAKQDADNKASHDLASLAPGFSQVVKRLRLQ